MADEGRLAQSGREPLAETVDHDQQGAARRALHQTAKLGDEVGAVQRLNLLELDFLVLEPLRGIDQHAETQRGLDPRIERSEPEDLPSCASEPVFHGAVGGLSLPIGDKEIAIGALLAELGHGHAPEQEGLGPLQRAAGGDVQRMVEPESGDRQYGCQSE